MAIRLSTDQAFVDVDPALGASILSYGLTDGRQILRPSSDPKDGFSSACYLLLPWCNRIDHGITLPGGAWQAIQPTHSQHPLPIHGSAALSEWNVEESTSTLARLSLHCNWPDPFEYRADVSYALTGAALQITLGVQHLGDADLHYGLGLHPWFVRTARSKLQARATSFQITDARQIPIRTAAVGERPNWDFNQSQALPDDLIDTAFGGWDGQARLEIDEALAVKITSEPALQHFHVYSTGRSADFICFEPVSHPVNAHNAPSHPGLVQLSHGQSTSISVNISPQISG